MMKLNYTIISCLLLALAGCGGGSGSVGGVGSDSGASSGSPGGVTSPRPPSDDPPTTPVQSGTLTAGDHDDHLNVDHFQAYVNDALQSVAADANYPKIDLAQRIIVKVVDQNDAPYRAALITIINGTQTLTRVITAADGLAYLYVDLDELPDSFRIDVSDQLGVTQLSRDFVLADLNEQRTIDFSLQADSPPTTRLDLLLVIDTTGSMGDELDYLKAELSSIVGSVKSANPNLDLRAGLVVYRDAGDDYVVRAHEFTNDVAQLQALLNEQEHKGGGDYPEAMDQALARAMAFDWRDQGTKVMLLVADAPPHADRVLATWSAALDARSRKIHIVPVAASGVAASAQYLMRSMAALTQSRYVFLTDDSGVGNPHEEPDIRCYVVTRLDSLIGRVIDDLIKGSRSEPNVDEIIRTVGNYDNGRCLDSQ